MSLSRRSFLNTGSLLVLPAILPAPVARRFSQGSASAPVETSFPTQPIALVKEMVTVAHGNVARVKELVTRQPSLAKAAWDWGFGDWEDALGAASHVGSREIAQILLDHGARPTMFSAAMLGQVDALKAFITASPGIEATLGPHSITLLSHARAGGPAAKDALEYLGTLPKSDARPATVPISVEEMSTLAGTYVFGGAADERIMIALVKEAITFQRIGGTARGLSHAGERAFFPMGAPHVRIRFRETAAAVALSVYDPDLVLTAERV